MSAVTQSIPPIPPLFSTTIAEKLSRLSRHELNNTFKEAIENADKDTYMAVLNNALLFNKITEDTWIEATELALKHNSEGFFPPIFASKLVNYIPNECFCNGLQWTGYHGDVDLFQKIINDAQLMEWIRITSSTDPNSDLNQAFCGAVENGHSNIVKIYMDDPQLYSVLTQDTLEYSLRKATKPLDHKKEHLEIANMLLKKIKIQYFRHPQFNIDQFLTNYTKLKREFDYKSV